MKKLMFATALVASAAAFADGPLNAISFEGYARDAVFTNGQAEKDEEGVIKSDATYGYFFYEGDTDGSSVKGFDTGDVATPSIKRPYCFQSATAGTNYLELSTEGGTLWRSINTLNVDNSGESPVYDLGTAKAIAAAGTYLDTLVQFTPTEEGGGPTDLTADDKLAIWLNVDQDTGATNLMVKAKYYFFNGQIDASETNYVLTAVTGTKNVVAGEWYRLTVRAIPNVMSDDTQGVLSVFEIYIDGVQMCATMAPFDASEGGFGTMLRTMVPEALLSAYDANALFPSLAPYGNTGDTPTLTAVGFKGSGALDDIVWTEEDPLQNSAGGDGYKVVIDGSDVTIMPQAGDLEAIGQALPGLDVNNPTAVNTVLATPIEGTGTPGIPVWQALFLGVAPTTNGLEQVAIKSVTIENGTVTVAMSDDLTLMTGRGVDIVLKVLGSDDLSTWDTTTPLATATNTLTIPAITPAANETKKFYKVVVDFAESN